MMQLVKSIAAKSILCVGQRRVPLAVLAPALALGAFSVLGSTGSGCTSHSISKTALDTAHLTMPLLQQTSTLLQRPLPHIVKLESYRGRRRKSGSVLCSGRTTVLRGTSKAATNRLVGQRPTNLLKKGPKRFMFIQNLSPTDTTSHDDGESRGQSPTLR